MFGYFVGSLFGRVAFFVLQQGTGRFGPGHEEGRARFSKRLNTGVTFQLVKDREGLFGFTKRGQCPCFANSCLDPRNEKAMGLTKTLRLNGRVEGSFVILSLTGEPGELDVSVGLRTPELVASGLGERGDSLSSCEVDIPESSREGCGDEFCKHGSRLITDEVCRVRCADQPKAGLFQFALMDAGEADLDHPFDGLVAKALLNRPLKDWKGPLDAEVPMSAVGCQCGEIGPHVDASKHGKSTMGFHRDESLLGSIELS